MATTLPPYLSLDEVQVRLNVIFKPEFPDRGILVGDMAARVVFVALYGGFVEGANRFFRPSTVIRFSAAQAALSGDADRLSWLAAAQSPGYKPVGQWYADNTREPVRDDYIRNRAIPIGIIKKREGVPPTSPAPIYSLSMSFTALFDPALVDELEAAINDWQERNLDQMTLKRMRLIARGVSAREGHVDVTLPNTGKMLRLAAGDASAITRDVCEVLAPRLCNHAVVVHVSLSDHKLFRELEGEAEDIGLAFNPNAELPDVVFVDVGFHEGMLLYFVEVVHSDGVVSELRRSSLLAIAREAGIDEKYVTLITAFADRNSPPFKKRVSELARQSMVWFASEPDLVLRLENLPERQAKDA